MYWSRFLLIPATAFAALLLNSCADTPPKAPAGPWKYRQPLKKNYPPITDHELKLLPVRVQPAYAAGSNVEITFRLVNRGRRSVKIPEWLMDIEDNLKIYYRPRKEDDEAAFDPSQWKCEQTHLPAYPRRFELVLNPGNAVLVTRKLSFIKSLPKPTQPQQYQIIAATALTSLELKSEVLTITVE